MKQLTVRVMWCQFCDQPENHNIQYLGTQIKSTVTHAKFDAECVRCKDRHALHIISESHVTRHLIPINDYNALIGRIIYDGVFAP